MYGHFGIQLGRFFVCLVWFLQNYDLAIVIFGIYPKELKTYVHKNTCTQMFMSALLITAKTWK